MLSLYRISNQIFQGCLWICLGLLSVACSSSNQKESAAVEPQRLSVAVLHTPDALPLFVAQDLGYFTQENLEVELIPFQSTMERDSAFIAHRVEGMTSDMISALLLKQSGCDVQIPRLSAGEKAGDGRVAILAAPGSSIQTPIDLKNSEIGISQHSVIELITDQLLAAEGLKAEEVHKVIVPKISIRLSLLLENKISAATLGEPYASYAEAHGAKVIMTDKKHNVSQAVLVFHNKTIEKKQPAMQAMMRALNRATVAINADPKKYERVLAELMALPDEFIEHFRLSHLPVNQVPQTAQLECVMQWLEEKGLLHQQFAYEEVVTDVCLEDAPLICCAS